MVFLTAKKHKGLAIALVLFGIFWAEMSNSAPIVVVPGEWAGYIYYSASAGAPAAAPAEDPSFVGLVGAFIQAPLPDGWVACEGQTVSTTSYPKLVAYLAGASATSATIPNLRGYFLRGVNPGATGVDPPQEIYRGACLDHMPIRGLQEGIAMPLGRQQSQAVTITK